VNNTQYKKLNIEEDITYRRMTYTRSDIYFLSVKECTSFYASQREWDGSGVKVVRHQAREMMGWESLPLKVVLPYALLYNNKNDEKMF